MTVFEIELSVKAQRDLNRLNNSDCDSVVDVLKKIETSPFPKKKFIKKIKGTKHPIYRARAEAGSGSFRIFYSVVSSKTILVLRIVSKKDADRILRKYK